LALAASENSRLGNTRLFVEMEGLTLGIHARAAFEDAPEDVDMTMFEASGPDADSIGRAAAELVAKVCEAHPFCDLPLQPAGLQC
jgi:hypothetical protein